MEGNNQTSSSMEFLLPGFSDQFRLWIFFFSILLGLHLATLAGNLLILLAVSAEPSRPPMLFFLCQLSAIKFCYTLIITPKALADLLSSRKGTISFMGCATQMHFFVALGGPECFLLAAMSYDHNIAICQPLHYMAVVNQAFCLQLFVTCCLAGFVVSLGLTVAIFHLPFCSSRNIDHFFCDVPALLHLACTKSYINELPLLVTCTLILFLPFLLILISYTCICLVVMRIHDSSGRGKAFFTCISYPVVTVLHYGCASFIYVQPKSSYLPHQEKMVALIYTNITPLLYPLIYSVRNKEIKGAVRKLLQKLITHPNCSIFKSRPAHF